MIINYNFIKFNCSYIPFLTPVAAAATILKNKKIANNFFFATKDLDFENYDYFCV